MSMQEIRIKVFIRNQSQFDNLINHLSKHYTLIRVSRLTKDTDFNNSYFALINMVEL